MSFDLNAWASQEKPTHYTYEIKGVSANALKVQRNDKVTPQTFSKKTFQALLEEGRLTILNNSTFQVEIDKEWNPDSQFDNLD
jgi:hypothetical protein